MKLKYFISILLVHFQGKVEGFGLLWGVGCFLGGRVQVFLVWGFFLLVGFFCCWGFVCGFCFFKIKTH